MYKNVFLYLLTFEGKQMYYRVSDYSSEDKLMELVFSFGGVGLRDGTQVAISLVPCTRSVNVKFS